MIQFIFGMCAGLGISALIMFAILMWTHTHKLAVATGLLNANNAEVIDLLSQKNALLDQLCEIIKQK